MKTLHCVADGRIFVQCLGRIRGVRHFARIPAISIFKHSSARTDRCAGPMQPVRKRAALRTVPAGGQGHNDTTKGKARAPSRRMPESLHWNGMIALRTNISEIEHKPAQTEHTYYTSMPSFVSVSYLSFL
jgi:hypothetical protein